MRAISYMYQQSGGCNHRHFCKECAYFEQRSRGVAKTGFRAGMTDYEYHCMKHPEHADWNPTWLSCKFFTEKKPKSKSKKSLSSSLEDKMTKNAHQMTIMELLGAET